MLQSVAQESLQNEKPISAKAFMQSIQTLFGNSIAGNAYWELILSGFMQFLDVDDWWIGEESWQNSIPCARVAKRGEMLLVKLAEVGDETLRLENPILARHKEVDYLIQLHQYAEASSLNSKVLRDFPGSPRAHFNQARIDAQLSCAPLAERDRLLGAARVSLAEAVEHGIVKLLVLTGNPEECRKPLDIVRNDNCLAPLFARWPEISKRLTDPKYIRERQGAAGGCVGSHMAIELPGGGMKAASDLKIGDRIIAWDTERSAKAEARIVAVQHHISQDAYMFNETYCFTSVHPVLTPLGWVRAGSMEIGMDLCMGTGAADRVTSIRKLNQLCEVIDITVDPYSTFIAGGLIVHNKR
jgi:hypothetical protein